MFAKGKSKLDGIKLKIQLFVLLFFFAFCACKKDSATTKPSLSLDYISSYVIPVNGTLTLTLNFKDKQSDIDTLKVYRKRMNKRTVSTTLRDSFKLLIPDYGFSLKGSFNIDFTYQNYLVSALNPPFIGNTSKYESDTMNYKFVAIDKQKYSSDTLYIDGIVVER